MAFAMLQELGGLAGTPDVGTNDADNSGNGVVSALENIAVNFGAGAASVGLNALANKAGVSPVVAPYSAGTLARAPGSSIYVARPPSPAVTGAGMLLVGGLFIAVTVGVIVAIVRR